MSSRALVLFVAVAAAMPGTHAFAQIAPPPPETATAPAAEYHRAPIATPTKKAQQAKVALPDLPYDSLVKRDASGKVIRLTEPVTWLASRRNPTITAEDWKKLEPVFAERKAECEKIVVNNLDLVEKVEAGDLRHVKGDAKTIVTTITRVYQPLKPSGGNFSSKLAKDGMLTEVQSNFSLEIETEYNKAVRAEVSANAQREEGQEIQRMAIVFQVFMEQIDETMCTYHDLLAETARSLDRVVPSLGWSSEVTASIDADRKAVGAAADDESRVAALHKLLDKLDLAQRRALLAKVIETRKTQ